MGRAGHAGGAGGDAGGDAVGAGGDADDAILPHFCSLFLEFEFTRIMVVNGGKWRLLMVKNRE